MPIVKSLYRISTGEFKNKQGLFECGPFEPQRPVLSVSPEGITTYDPDYDVVVVTRFPDPRTERWDGSAIVSKTDIELAAYDAAQPLWIDGREVMRRLADSTHLGLERLSQTDAAVCKLWNTLKAGGDVNVHGAEFTEGAAHLRIAGVPSVWPDVAAFDAELASQQRQ